MKKLRKADTQRLEEYAYENRRDLTRAERAMVDILIGLGWRFNVEHPKGKFNIIMDFYVHSKKLVIEVDGSCHRGQEERDKKRDKTLVARGFSVCRFTNDQVLNFPRKTRATILKAVSLPVSDVKIQKLPPARGYFPKIQYPSRVLHEGGL